MKGKYKVLYYTCVYLLIIIIKANYTIQQEKNAKIQNIISYNFLMLNMVPSSKIVCVDKIFF